MHPIRITLLGPLNVRLGDGTDAAFTTQKARALLAVLALAGPGGADRDELAGLLWSRSPQAQARTNLRQALAGLRKALGADAGHVRSHGNHISLAEAGVQIDADGLLDGSLPFDEALGVSTLLEGMQIDEPGFEAWLAQERSRMGEALRADLLARGEGFVAGAEYTNALRAARRLIELDAFFEAAYRLEMRALAGLGEAASALKAYARLEDLLQRELGVAPGEETEELQRAIRSGEQEARGTERSLDHQATAPAPDDAPRPTAQGVEKPAIAVRPFANLSGDPGQDYLSQGFTEDLVTELSRLTLVSVSVLHGGEEVKAAELGYGHLRRDFGIHFVLEGTVRKAAERVRVAARMIEADSGKTLWAENFDRELRDIFEVQTDVARSIASVIPGRVMRAVVERAARKPPANVKAYEYYLQGRSVRDSFSAEATVAGRELFRKAIEADDRYAKAYGLLADTYFVDFMLGLGTEEAARLCHDLQVKSVEIDPDDVMLQEGMGFAYIAMGLWDDASAQFDRAIALIRHEAEQLLWCGFGLTLCGRHDEALEIVRQAIGMDPLHPSSFEWVYGQSLFFAGNAAKANEVLRGDALLNSVALACRVGTHAELGDVAAARSGLEAFLRTRRQEFESRGIPIAAEDVETLAGGYRAMLRRTEDWDRLTSGLRRAGLSG